MTSARPLVSVVMSTYNRHARLMQALASVARQTYDRLQVIVVNDGSTEPAYQSAPRPANVVWIDLPVNTRATFGYPCLGHVRNVGIAHASGEYLAFLDDDDLWLPDKIARQVAAIHGTRVRMCCTEVFASDGAPCADLAYPWYLRDKVGVNLPSHLELVHLDEINYIMHSSVLLQRGLYDEAGPYLEIPLQGHRVDGRLVVEDWELWRSCMRYSSALYIPEPLAYYDIKVSASRRRRYRARVAAQRLCRKLFGVPKTIKVVY